MTSESDLAEIVQRELGDGRPNSDLVRIEDVLRAGVPDINYLINGAEGWLELKYLPNWPAKPATPVRVRHYTDDQRRWHLRRARAGGRMWVLLAVGRAVPTFVLLSGAVAARELGRTTRAELRALARIWDESGTFPRYAIREVLTAPLLPGLR